MRVPHTFRLTSAKAEIDIRYIHTLADGTVQKRSVQYNFKLFRANIQFNLQINMRYNRKFKVVIHGEGGRGGCVSLNVSLFNLFSCFFKKNVVGCGRAEGGGGELNISSYPPAFPPGHPTYIFPFSNGIYPWENV